MTDFEQFLMDNGYLKFVLDFKDMKFKETNRHTISTMVNIDHRYIHKSDTNVLNKIKKGIPVTDKNFTWADRKGEICFGLSEELKPPTLIFPRPQIRVKRNKGGKVVIEDESHDDSMNFVLDTDTITYGKILEAMFNDAICFEIDLTGGVT